ncbi:MAG TPA: histidine phosphatase family protein [Gaiellaceae bacterium]
MTTILLVRHGETDWNRDRRWQGHADPPLNEAGRRQSERLAETLLADPPAAVYSSDLRRARETAEIVARRLDLPVQTDPRLREVDVGEWSGLTLAEVERLYPEGMRRREAGGTGWERGETYEAMGERVVAALQEIAAAHDGGRVLVVTHGGAMGRVWLACGLSLDDRPRVANCDVHRVEIENGAIAPID